MEKQAEATIYGCCSNTAVRVSKMFAARTKALVRNLGARGDLIYNKNVNDKVQMLTLVKVRKKKLWPVITYSIINQTLLDLLEEADVSPGVYSHTL
ncbi:hypothetical protein Q5P01_024090 [Channa striata]|uniref:Gasdermin pore forming domain-containing protein n=1 Tax=Channa striata TaxID=64152 RepID=A0AA88LPR5_CHASR|nr:hypothetical protein Q5P01_024090 [Channa striata]